ncbi:unnamed protein product [Rotaria socialis]|uniref:Bromo domain-containing protein n=2 Tax=Rotaria socialis TaxID=392032 RepID=A0A818MZE9_9BILA|nr:unnamed protein product [Rotaria socialis]
MASSPGLNFLIAKYLRGLPNSNLANEFVQSLEQNNLLPSTHNWNGVERQISFSELEQQYAHVPDNHLFHLLENVMSYVEQGIGKRFGSLSTFLLQLDPTCFLENKQKKSSTRKYNMFTTAYHPCKYLSNPTNRNMQIILREREYFGRTLSVKQLPASDLYQRMNMRLKVIAHKASIYCIAFDRTGTYALSGADDFLLKMWHVHTGRLLATFRGHSKEICDIDVNFENTLVASASLDKKVRVWNLKTTKMECVLHGHQSGINATKFSPFCKTDDRWLASVGHDGSICFWKYPIGTTDFEPRPIKFVEKSRAGAQMLCLSFSPGGYFVAAGSSDSVIRVYSFHTYSPLKICELDRHTSVVETLCYSHLTNSFISGSKDGTARIWRYEQQTWRAIVLNYNDDSDKNNNDSNNHLTAVSNKVIPVTIVSWSCTDRHVATAYENGLIKVWEPNQGTLVNELKKHEKTVFVLECHPTNERLLCSAGHDGLLVIWDMVDGRVIKSFLNDQYIDIPCSIPYSEAKWSPHCDVICTTDLCGQICFFGLGTDTRYNKTQIEQFFHNDLRPVIRDSNDDVLDEQQQLPPHLLPPPYLIDDHGHAYSYDIQRCVPGRENYSQNDNTATVVNHEYLEDLIIAEPMTTPGMTSAFMTRKFGSTTLKINRFFLHNINFYLETVDLSTFRLNIDKKQTFVYHRNLTSPLNEAELEYSESIRDARYDEERIAYEREYLKKIDHRDLYESSPIKKRTTRNVIKMRQEELLKKVPHNVEVAINRLTTRALYDSDKEDKTDLSDDQYSPNAVIPLGDSEMSGGGDDDSVSTDEDLVVTTTRTTGIMTRTGQQRRVQRHRNLSPDEDDDEDDEEDEDKRERENRQVQEAKTQHRRRNKLKRLKKRREQVKTKKEEFENKHELELNYSSDFKPPDWLTRILAKCSPYIPQIGDTVMYFIQGHELYINEVKDKKMYEIDEKTLPWNKCESIDAVECATVIGVSISFSDKQPPRVINVRLQLLNPDTLEATSKRISVKFHDIDGIADFIILKQYYDQAVQREWKAGDNFRCFIDDTWWPGTIVKREAFDPRHETSPFQCYIIRWDNGENEERLSPWDIFECDDSPSESSESNLTKMPSYQPVADEWPSHGIDEERERLLNGFDTLIQMDITVQFRAPVQLAWYPVVIAYPIDLGTIRERISNGYYRRSNALKWDVKKIEENAKNFNEKGSQIIEQVKLVTKILLKYIDDHNCNDINIIYQRALHSEQVSLPMSTSWTEEWLDDCQTILNDILSQPGSDLLRYPIDENEYPDYERIIKTPICFDDIQTKLHQNPCGYRHSREFIADCHLIFQNALTYADPEMINVVRHLGPWFDQRVAIFDRRQRRTNPQYTSEMTTRRRDLQNSSADENNVYTTTGDLLPSLPITTAAAAAAATATTTTTTTTTTTAVAVTTSSSSRQNRRTQFSPTALTADRRHSHFNRASTVNNHSVTSQQQNSDDDDMDDDNESVSTRSTQPISLTSFINPIAHDHNIGVGLSLRQTRQRLHANESNSSWPTRTRYSTRSTASNRHHNDDYDNRSQQPSSSSRILSASDDDDNDNNDISSNSKRNRIERSDRRITSINRPNYKIDSDDHEDDEDEEENDDDHQQKPNKTNGTNNNQEDIEQTEKDNDKSKLRTDDEDYEPPGSHGGEEDEDEDPNELLSTRQKDDDSDSDFQLNEPSQHRRTNTNGNRVRKLRSTTNRPSPPLPNQNNKRKRSTIRTRSSSSESDSSDSNVNTTQKTRTRSRRRVTVNRKSSFAEDISDEDQDEEGENRRRPRTTQPTRVSKRGRVLKQRLLSE